MDAKLLLRQSVELQQSTEQLIWEELLQETAQDMVQFTV